MYAKNSNIYRDVITCKPHINSWTWSWPQPFLFNVWKISSISRGAKGILKKETNERLK